MSNMAHWKHVLNSKRPQKHGKRRSSCRKNKVWSGDVPDASASIRQQVSLVRAPPPGTQNNSEHVLPMDTGVAVYLARKPAAAREASSGNVVFAIASATALYLKRLRRSA